ncbi:MAG TPA: hypothetical protein QF730_04365 [Planctomycetota bacterium]|jgi:hypothetical protein|nr:hypothetical protein [Planctomycetota bacterium]
MAGANRGPDRGPDRGPGHEPGREPGCRAGGGAEIGTEIDTDPSPSAGIAGPRAARLRTALLLLLAVILFCWSRGTWPDPLVDFGRELYVPWRLSLGEALYRDIAWQDGALPPLWNGLLFRVFGAGLSVLVAGNVLVAAAVAGLLRRLFARAGSRAGADLALLFFLLLFAFPRYLNTGNYNFMSPYSHGLTHGLLLALLSLEGLERWCAGRRGSQACWSGLALGLVFLTKPEVFLAAALAWLVRLACALGAGSQAHASRARASRANAGSAAGALLGLLIGPAVTFAYLRWDLDAAGAWHGVLGGWLHLVRGGAAGSTFYLRGMGLENVVSNLLHLGSWALVLGGAWWCALKLPQLPLFRASAVRHRRPAGALLFVLCALPATLSGDALPGPGLARAWPLFMVLLGSWCLRRWWLATNNPGPGRGSREAARLALVVFAAVLLGKMLLNARIHHYGFVLALPATLVLVVAAWDWLPAALSRGAGAPGVALLSMRRAAVLGLVLSVLPWHLGRSGELYKRQTARLGEGADSFLADGRGRLVRSALGEIEARTESAETLLVLPEGVMLNYLARRATPTPFINFMPPEFAFFGGQTMLAALRASPPDLVVLVHKDTSEYGLPLFGRDFGVELMDWVRSNYVESWRVGAKPLERAHSRFGLAILEPRPADLAD